jgi:hypothetical protein
VDGEKLSSVLVSDVLNEEKKQQAIALGRLGWSLRQIQKAIGVHRGTISVFLKAAGIAIRMPRGQDIPEKPASLDEVITDSAGESTEAGEVKPDSQPGRSPSSSACQPYQDVIDSGSPGAETPWRSGRSRWIPAESPPATRVSGGSSPGCRAASLRSRAPLSRPPPMKRLKSITATALWSTIRRAASIGAHDCS